MAGITGPSGRPCTGPRKFLTIIMVMAPMVIPVMVIALMAILVTVMALMVFPVTVALPMVATRVMAILPMVAAILVDGAAQAGGGSFYNLLRD